MSNLYKIFGGVYRLPLSLSKKRIKELVNKGYEAEVSGHKDLLTLMKEANINFFCVGKKRYQLIDGEYVLLQDETLSLGEFLKTCEKAGLSPEINRDVKAYFEGKEFWSGSVNLLDGTIEEVHTYDEAKKNDFQAFAYFSKSALEKMTDGQSAFFWVENGEIYGEWDDEKAYVILSIKDQIKILGSSQH